MDVLVFCPVYRLEKETVEAIFALEWDGPISYLFQRDNPLPVEAGFDAHTTRATGVKNHAHQYRRGREAFLTGRYDAMLVIESDIIPPPDALKRLASLDTDIAYGAYMFRVHEYNLGSTPVVNLYHRYQLPDNRRARNIGESLSLRDLWPPKEYGPMDVSGAGLGCVLIKRHVLEAIDFRTLNPDLNPLVHCDMWFTSDAWAAGFDMRADTRVICGHKTPSGKVLWPPT